jgi:class 3 adenylate cyclase/tetratricopeptide (TPR) repeat protein
MELLADRDPEEARRILDPLLGHIMEAVHRYEGTVNQVMGDGIMALFGAPLAHEDHAVRACYAALRIQESAKRFAEEAFRSHGIAVQVRVGLNSGEVVVRAIGSDLHMDYTAVGQTTHLAARMEQLADPGTTLLTPATLQLAEGYVEVKSRGSVPIKGLSEPMEVFDLLGAGAARSRLLAALGRGLTRFIGRDGEVEQLHRLFERARAGHGQVAAVVGEPGVGKSRLYHEFLHSPNEQGWLVLQSGSVSYGKATAYLPLIELLKVYFGIDEREDTAAIREQVTRKLLALDRALEPTLPALLSLLGAEVDDSDWKRLDPLQRRERILDGVKRLLIRESHVQPLVLLVEDLHWIDSESQVLLDRLVESLPTTRMFLLVNYRPEYTHQWSSKTYYTQLRLDTLSAPGAEELLRFLLGDDVGLQPLKRLLIQRTEGNPFFLEESVRTLVETKVLVGERGAYRGERSVEAIEVPATVQAVLAARIDRLTAEARDILQVASVVGEVVPLPILQAVAGVSDDALRRDLAYLQAAEFLYEVSLYPDLEYTFKHGLTYQVAYSSLLLDRRRVLHARIAETIEELYSERLTEHVERLAHHAFRAEQWERAVKFFRQAGAKAAAQSAYREAVISLEQALAALRHLPETCETITQGIDVRFELRTELQPLNEHERVLTYLREAEVLASTLEDQSRLGWASVYLSQYAWIQGDVGRSEELAHRALAIASDLGEFPLRVAADYILAQGYFHLGDYSRAIEHSRPNVDVLRGARAYERSGFTGLPSLLARLYLSGSLTARGEFAEAIRHGRDAVEIAETVGQPYNVVVACFAASLPHLEQGSFRDAIAFAERGVGVARTWNVRLLLPGVVSVLGSAYRMTRRLAEGLVLLEEGAALIGGGLSMGGLATMVRLGQGYLAAGRADDAVGLALRALTVATNRKARGDRVDVLRLLGEASAARDSIDMQQAEDYFHQALTDAAELGMRPAVAHCHAGLGKLYRRTGKREHAQKEFTTAATMFRDMDMRFWLEQAEAEMTGSG